MGMKRSTWNDYRHAFKERLEALWGERVLAEICRRRREGLSLAAATARTLDRPMSANISAFVSSIVSEAVDDELLASESSRSIAQAGRVRSNSGHHSPAFTLSDLHPSSPVQPPAIRQFVWVPWCIQVHPDTGYTVPAKTVPLKKKRVILRKARPG